MRYFKFRWNEPDGDEFDDWGKSTFYQEVDKEFWAIRQIEIYDNGNVLKYDEKHSGDEFGMLADQRLKEVIKDQTISEITQEEFEQIWRSVSAINN